MQKFEMVLETNRKVCLAPRSTVHRRLSEQLGMKNNQRDTMVVAVVVSCLQKY